jgi:hypothetical protein
LKKGGAYEIFWYTLLRLPILVILFSLLGYISYSLSVNALDSHRVNDIIIANRIIYSPNALAYQDPETLRVYPGIIDLSKAEQSEFEKGFLTMDITRAASRIEISDADGNPLREVYINEVWYNRWTPLVGFQQYDMSVFRYPVLIREGGYYRSGVIKISVVGPNE